MAARAAGADPAFLARRPAAAGPRQSRRGQRVRLGQRNRRRAHRRLARRDGVDGICATHSGLPWVRRTARGFWCNVVCSDVPRTTARGASAMRWFRFPRADARPHAELVPLDYDVAPVCGCNPRRRPARSLRRRARAGRLDQLRVDPARCRTRGSPRRCGAALPAFHRTDHPCTRPCPCSGRLISRRSVGGARHVAGQPGAIAATRPACIATLTRAPIARR